MAQMIIGDFGVVPEVGVLGVLFFGFLVSKMGY